MFEKVLAVIKCYPDFEKLHLDNVKVAAFPSLEIHPERSHYILHTEYKEKFGWASFLIYTVCKGTGILYGSGNRRITINHITVWVIPGCFS